AARARPSPRSSASPPQAAAAKPWIWSSPASTAAAAPSEPTAAEPGPVPLRFGENPGFGAGKSRLGCRSTALGANRPSPHSHPGRVLLRCEVVAASFVGAPPRCESEVRPKHRASPGAKAEPSQDTESAPFAPGAGAP